MTKPDDDMAKLVAMQQHRDAWRGYAYGTRQKPQDFLDGNMVDRQPTLQESQSAELARVRGLLQRHAARLFTCAKWLGESKSEGWAQEVVNWANDALAASKSEAGAESAHSGKHNTADKSGPTQLPKEKS